MRFAVIGGGYGAAVYLPALAQVPGCTAVSLACRTPKPDVAVEQCSDWRALVSRKDIDAVVVALPPHLHREVVCAFASTGKAILCEKPAGICADDAAAMLDACEKNGVKHAVGYQFRFEPGFQALKSQVADGRVGKIERIEIDWLVGSTYSRSRPWTWRNDVIQGGGVVLNFASHCIDYLHWLTSAAPKLSARCEQILVPSRKDATGNARIVTAPDACDLLFGFETGAVASLRIANLVLQPLGHRVVIRGDGGTIELLYRPPFGPQNLLLSWETPSRAMGSQSGLDLGMRNQGRDSRIAPTIEMLRMVATQWAGRPSSDLANLRDALAMHVALEGEKSVT